MVKRYRGKVGYRVDDETTLSDLRNLFPQSPYTARRALDMLRYDPNSRLTARQIEIILKEQDATRRAAL